MNPVCVVPPAVALCAGQQQARSGRSGSQARCSWQGETRWLSSVTCGASDGEGELAAAQHGSSGSSPVPSAWRLRCPAHGCPVQPLGCWSQQRRAHPRAASHGVSWQRLAPGLHMAGINSAETPGGGEGGSLSPQGVCGAAPSSWDPEGEQSSAHGLPRTVGNTGVTRERDWGGLTGRAQFARSKAACNGLGVGVWQRLGSAYSCCCSLCSPAPFPLS